jgi:hypothetical protein
MSDQIEKLALELLFRRLDKIEVIMSKIDERLDSVDVTLGKQHVSLENHIRRTELAERQIAIVNSHVDNMKGASKTLVIVSGIVVLIGALYGLFKIFNGVN